MGLIVRNINMAGRLRGTFPQVPPPPPAPNIVTSGLIMNLDAGNPASYPGLNNGRTWSTGWSGNFVNPESSFDGSLSSGTQVAADNQSATYTFASGGLSVTGTVRVAVALGASSGQAGDITNIILINGVDITQKIKDAGLYLTVGWIDVTSEVGATFNTIVLNRIFGRANPFLCAIEVNGQVLLNNTTNWVDLTGNGNNGTLVNGPTYSSANGGSIVFDGVNDYVSVQTTNYLNFGSNNFSIECVCYYNLSTSTDDTYRSLFVIGSETNYLSIIKWRSGLENGILVDYCASGNRYCISTSNIVPTPNAATTITSPLYDAPFKWSSFIISVTSNVMTLYVNGIAYGSVSLGQRWNQNQSLSIGMNANSNFMLGHVSIVRAYQNKALTASEVTQNFNATKSRYGL